MCFVGCSVFTKACCLNATGLLYSFRPCTEHQYALLLQIPDEKLILSHTPMQHLLPQYQDSSVLVVGAGRSLQAAHAYGFSKALSPLQLAAALGPDSAPFSNVPTPGDVSSRLGLPCPVQVYDPSDHTACIYLCETKCQELLVPCTIL